MMQSPVQRGASFVAQHQDHPFLSRARRRNQQRESAAVREDEPMDDVLRGRKLQIELARKDETPERRIALRVDCHVTFVTAWLERSEFAELEQTLLGHVEVRKGVAPIR